MLIISIEIRIVGLILKPSVSYQKVCQESTSSKKMIPRLYLITYFFKIVLISHIDSKVIKIGQIDDVLLKDDEVEKNPDLETTQSANKLFGEGRCKYI